MSNTNKKFYLTTPIYYVNARPHIGHAYTTIAADVIARRHRLLGDDTFFLTGTDEHGQKIERSAAAAGIPPQQFADQVSSEFRNLWKRMGITNNKFIRTTDEAHKKGAQKLFALLQKNGFIELRAYTGQYCISDETFVDVPVGAPCPECGRITETVTEENYFFKLSAFQRPLIDLIESNQLAIQPDSRKNEVLSFLRGNVNQPSPETGSNPETTDSKSVILSGAKNPRISPEAPTSPSESTIAHSTAGTPYVPGVLKDLSISRSSFKWGIPVPGDEKHVIYVWLDALTNYMTAIGYGSDDPAEQEKFNRYWPADLHLVGKEIIRFHCVYWPAFLLALNPAIVGQEPEDVPFEVHSAWAKQMLPKAITAHGWLLFEDSKMSKSRGNIVRTETILDAFGTLCPPSTNTVTLSPPSTNTVTLSPPSTSTVILSEAKNPRILPEAPTTSPEKHEQDLFAADVLRYFLLREIPFGQDGSFSFDALVRRYNAELANGYGNLVSRTFSMIFKYFDGIIPSLRSPESVSERKPIEPGGNNDWFFYHPKSLAENGGAFLVQIQRAFASTDSPVNLNDLHSIPLSTDTVISAAQPWKKDLANAEERKVVEDVLYFAAEAIRLYTAAIYPILPYATAKVWAQLGLGDIQLASDNGELRTLTWGGLQPGTKLGPLSPIFPRADKGLIQIMTDMETANAPTTKSVVSQKSVVANAGLPHVNADLDASTPTHTEFRESPISSESATASLNPIAESTHPITAHHPDPAAALTPDTPQISIDDFVKIDLRVAKIVVAERIPKADKLLRLEVDLGYETRQILSGIAQWYTPEELIGRRIVVIANLAPRKMRGLESHGMLLAASHGEDGKPVLATFAEDIALGSRLK